MGDIMKKGILYIVLIIFSGFCIINNDEIVSFLVKSFVKIEKVNTPLVNNQYSSNQSYKYVQLTSNFKPSDRQDLMNIYYTVLNSGMTNFTFYCPDEYKNCLNDVNDISKNQILLSNINNYVPTYNSFKNIDTEFDSFGKVNITINHNYDENQINELETTTSNILNNLVTTDMKIDSKIKILHDYIINNTKYDKERSDNKVKKYHSDIAYGALLEHYAICGGYADAMKLFLDKLNIPNYKISSENHVWNLVYINNDWYHLDLTWDDPVSEDGTDMLEYNYFLITTDELQALETDQHIYDKVVYKEAN